MATIYSNFNKSSFHACFTSFSSIIFIPSFPFSFLSSPSSRSEFSLLFFFISFLFFLFCFISLWFHLFKHYCLCQSRERFSKRNANWTVILSFFVYILSLLLLYFIKHPSLLYQHLFHHDDGSLKLKHFNVYFPSE